MLDFWLEVPAFEGRWFDVLEEVKLFAESARGTLRDVLAQARGHARKPADAIALLYLETKLFAFPEDAAEVLRRRADLGELLADLVPLAKEPAIRALLAEKAMLADCSQSVIKDFGGDFGRAFGNPFVSESSFGSLPNFVSSFAGDFVRGFGPGFVRDFVPLFARDSVFSFVRDVMPLGGDVLLGLVVREFDIEPNEPGWKQVWDRAMEDETNQSRELQNEFFWVLTALTWGDCDVDPRSITSALQSELKNPLALPLLLAGIWSAASAHMLFASFRHAVAARCEASEETLETWLLRNPIQVYSTAFAWQEHCKPITKLEGPAGALLLAHAAYASLMTGLECKLPTAPNLVDPRVRFSHLLYELCNFRDPEANARQLQDAIATPAPELRPLLEAAGLLVASPGAANPAPNSIRIEPADRPTPAPEPPSFTWLHLSDIHIGHGDASRRWDQRLVLDALRRDVADYRAHGAPRPDALFITGDIAQSGAPDQYANARAWLDALASSLSLPPDRVFLVPGNHDVVRSAGIKDRGLDRLLRGLRDRDESLDEDLGHPGDRALLTSRLAAYLSFASAYPSVRSPDPLFWSHAFATPDGLPVRLIGLSTPLLADGDVDRGKLRLGTASLAATLTDVDKSREFVLVLTHHPLRGGWLADQRDADRWLQSRAHVRLFGHVHEAESEDARSGAGVGLIRIAAGAAHGDLLPPGVPASHGYSIGAVVATGGGLRLRVWPRRWSDQSKNFRVDVDNVPEGSSYAEHPLPNIRLPARAGGPP